MAILVTGGAGYIGSHTVLYLQELGEEVVVLDNLSTGHLQNLKNVNYYIGNLSDNDILEQIFNENHIESVIHFAASSLVYESIIHPLEYYRNNVMETYHLINTMIKHNVKSIVFSSTAAVYGEPEYTPIDEGHNVNPTNPYGETKLAIEKMLKWSDSAYGLKSISLRYFNAAGADPKGRLGEDHQPESHLIPIILQVVSGQREKLKIFGNDHNTEDGTCIRDYIHVMDLAQAHYLAVQKLRDGADSTVFNLGNGRGYSVKQVIEACERELNVLIDKKVVPRRKGEPSALIATPSKAKNELGWQPLYSELEVMIKHAWNWHSKQENI